MSHEKSSQNKQPINVLSKKSLSKVALAASLVLPFSTYAPIVSSALVQQGTEGLPDDIPFTQSLPILKMSTEDQTSESVIVTIEFPEGSVTNEVKINNGDWFIYDGPLTFEENGTVEARSFNEEGEESLTAKLEVSNIITVQLDEDSNTGEVENLLPEASVVEKILVASDESVHVEIQEEVLEEEELQPVEEKVENTKDESEPKIEVDSPLEEELTEDETIEEESKEEETIEVPVTPPFKPTLHVESGVDSVEVQIDYPDAATHKQYRFTLVNGVTEGWLPYTGPLTFTINGLLEAQAIDSNDNPSEIVSHSITQFAEEVVERDSTPSISTSTDHPSTGPILVSIEYAESSVIREYRINGGEWLPYTVPFEVNSNGVIEARGTEKDGQASPVASHSITNIKAIELEEAKIHVAEFDEKERSVLVTILFPESAAISEYRIDGGEWQQYAAPFNITENGEIEARWFDNDGNESMITKLTVTSITAKENTAPKLSLFNSNSHRMMLMSNLSSTTKNLTLNQNTSETTEQTQIHTFTIPGLTKLNNVNVNTGSVEIIGVDGEKVTVRVSNGARTKQVQTGGSYTPERKETITDSRTATSNSFPSTVVKDGITLQKDGAVTETLISGSHTPAHTKTVSDSQLYLAFQEVLPSKYGGSPVTYQGITTYYSWDMTRTVRTRLNSPSSQKYYSLGGYVGYLSLIGDSYERLDVAVSSTSGYWFATGPNQYVTDHVYHRATYSGSVTKPAVDTRKFNYTQKYKGEKVIPESDTRTYEDYFQYELTFDYDTNTAPSVNLPAGTQTTSPVVPFNVIKLRGTAIDEEGDAMNLVVSVDSVPEIQNIKIPVSGVFDEEIELPPTLSEGTYIVSVYVEDEWGDRSEPETFEIFHDTTSPEIVIGGVVDGESYLDSATPIIHTSDNTSKTVTLDITLNGEPFTSGTPIDKQGDYTLVVTATDQIGNSSTESRTFTVNTKPEIIGSIPDSNLAKFETATFDLNQYFTNPQTGDLSFEVEVADNNLAQVTISGSILTIEAVKQGSTTLNIKAKNATSYSPVLSMIITVDNAVPAITFDEDTWSLVADDTAQLVVTGTVTDVDKDAQLISGDLSGLTATTSIPETEHETDLWELVFDTSNLHVGVYGPITVQTTDSFGGSHSTSRTKPVIKVKGDAATYMDIIHEYEADTGQVANDWFDTTHKTILEAYTAMQELANSNTVENQLAAAEKVQVLVAGTVKTNYENIIGSNAFEWLKQNLPIADVSHFTNAGIANVTESNLGDVRNWSILRLDGVGADAFQRSNIQEMVELAGDITSAQNAASVNRWLDVLTSGGHFNDSVKEELNNVVNHEIILVLNGDPKQLTSTLLTDYFGISATNENEADYQLYLADYIADSAEHLNQYHIAEVVGAVNHTNALLQSFQIDPIRETMQTYQAYVETLVDGLFKSKHADGFTGTLLLNFVTYPLEQQHEDFTKLGVTAVEANIPYYQPNLVSYIGDIGIPNMTVPMIQDVVNATDALLAYKANPSDQNLHDLIDAVDKLDPSTNLAKDMKEEIQDSILDAINQNPGNISVDELEEAGVTDVNPDLLPDYQDALEEYKKDIAPDELTLDDIQAVIDAINAVEHARQNPSTVTIGNAYDVVNKLKEGNLKEGLLQEIEDIAVDYIIDNPSTVVSDDLKHANLDQVNDNRLGDYQDYLQDVLPGISPAKKTDLQVVVDTVNEIHSLYDAVLNDPTRSNVELYIEAVEALEDGQMKLTYEGYIPSIAFEHLVTYPSDLQVDSLVWAEFTFEEDNLTTYQQWIPQYIGEVGKDSIDHSHYQAVIDWLDAYVLAMEMPNDDTIRDFHDAADLIDKSTNVYEELIKDVNSSLLENLNEDMSNVTKKQLEELGITDLNPDLMDEYQDALEEYRKDLLPDTLTVEDIQAIIDAINAVEHARANPSTDTIAIAYQAVEILKEGNLKTDLLKQLEDIAVEFIGNNPGTFTDRDLEHANITDVNPDLIEDYRMDMEDVYPILLPAQKADIQNVIYVINELNAVYLSVLADPTRENTMDFRTAVQSLMEGKIKDKYSTFLPIVALAHLSTYPTDVQADSLEWAEVTFEESNVSEYRKYLPSYQTDVTDFTTELLDTYTVAIDKFVVAMEQTVADNVIRAVDAINVLIDGFVKSTLLDELSVRVLGSINENPGNVTIEDLEQAGIKDLVSDNEHEYQEAHEEYQDNIGRDLTIDDIQKVVDSINDLIDAEKNPTPESLSDAKDAIDLLEDGSLKDKLIERLKDAAADRIEKDLENITPEDLDRAGIIDVNPDLIEEYQEYLDLYKPLTKEKIQSVIDVVNQLDRTLREVTVEELDALLALVENLDTSNLKSTLSNIHNIIREIAKYEMTGNGAEAVTVAVENVDTSTQIYLQSMIDAAESMHETRSSPTDEKIDEAIVTISDLMEGAYKSRLLEEVGVAYFDFVQNHPDKVTAHELVKAGFERVRPELLEEYRKGFVSVTGELGKQERPTLQLIIDVVNEIVDTKVEKSLAKARETKQLIETLPDSDWKDEKLSEINRLIAQYTPAPPVVTPPSHGNGSDDGYDRDQTPPKVEDTEQKPVPPVISEEPVDDSKPNVVEGVDTGSGYDFVIDEDVMAGIIENKSGTITLTQGDNVTIDIPLGAIDFDKLLEELGKYGLLIQLTKLDEKNYRLTVKAITPEGELEIKNFEKHLSVALRDKEQFARVGAMVASTTPMGIPIKHSYVLRKEGNELTAVPHKVQGQSFTIRTTRAGHFVVSNQKITFDDITKIYSKSDIEELASRHIVYGSTPTTYSPNAKITRAQLAAMMARALDLRPSKETHFTDVKGKWYADDVQALYEAGIIQGTTATTFDPGSYVTRQQAAAMMNRAMKYAGVNIDASGLTPDYTDVSQISQYAKGDVALLQSLTIMTGKEDNSFDPHANLTRAQMAKILSGALRHINFM